MCNYAIYDLTESGEVNTVKIHSWDVVVISCAETLRQGKKTCESEMKRRKSHAVNQEFNIHIFLHFRYTPCG